MAQVTQESRLRSVRAILHRSAIVAQHEQRRDVRDLLLSAHAAVDDAIERDAQWDRRRAYGPRRAGADASPS